MIAELKEISRELGRTPTTHDWPRLRAHGRVYPLYVYYAVFGSFLAALKRAKLKPRYKQEFNASDRERLLNELRDLRRKLGRTLFDVDVDKARRRKEVSPPYHFVRAFGSVPAAIEAAGAGKKVYTREEMIDILRKLDATLDRRIQQTDIQKSFDAGEGPSVKMFLKEFGTLSKARRAAGTQAVYHKAKERTTYWQKYTKKELIAQLMALGKKLARKPTDRDINAASKLGECASAGPFASMFGTLPNAYRAAGYTDIAPNSPRYTDDEILSAIGKLSKRYRRMPTFHELRRASIAGKCPSPGTIVRRIGKLTDLKSQFER
ncbi:MAG: homing endonuclease associated repeat-containing protein [Pyrinomonadaceae bacterium]